MVGADNQIMETVLGFMGTNRPGKDPLISSNGKGDTVIAWCEGARWKKGSLLRWQLFNGSDRLRTKSEVPLRFVKVWCFPVTVADGTGNFIHHFTVLTLG
ncbi:MAG: hypothetical protein M2R45_03004 [Verrucomicrobia subdivision 3 bacterium]|nr:hypothetical protein [Limisphaerales bacterium]MCS1416510.1 hypothetical protein [Limisphaerales bacterium]